MGGRLCLEKPQLLRRARQLPLRGAQPPSQAPHRSRTWPEALLPGAEPTQAAASKLSVLLLGTVAVGGPHPAEFACGSWGSDGVDWRGCNRPQEAGLFASPSRSFNGVPAGDAATGDCARNIRETAATVAAYRATRVAPLLPPTITLRNLDARKCVDASYLYSNGASVHVWDCHGGQNQQWELLLDGSMRVVGTNKCLDVDRAGTFNGALVIVWDCSGSNNQRWFYDTLGRLHPYHAASMCLDVAYGRTNNGNQFHIWNCQVNNNNQVFTAPSLGTPWSPHGRGIKSRLNNMCIDVFAYTYQNGGPVVMWPCNPQALNQIWYSDTIGALRSEHNLNFCLDASANSNGATVYIFACHSQDNQQWFMDPLGRLRPFSNPSRCLDIRGANPAQQTPLQLWDCVDVNQQRWYV